MFTYIPYICCSEISRDYILSYLVVPLLTNSFPGTVPKKYRYKMWNMWYMFIVFISCTVSGKSDNSIRTKRYLSSRSETLPSYRGEDNSLVSVFSCVNPVQCNNNQKKVCIWKISSTTQIPQLTLHFDRAQLWNKLYCHKALRIT